MQKDIRAAGGGVVGDKEQIVALADATSAGGNVSITPTSSARRLRAGRDRAECR
jgi:hypothetical protein